jgi:hypothetical protein
LSGRVLQELFSTSFSFVLFFSLSSFSTVFPFLPLPHPFSLLFLPPLSFSHNDDVKWKYWRKKSEFIIKIEKKCVLRKKVCNRKKKKRRKNTTKIFFSLSSFSRKKDGDGGEREGVREGGGGGKGRGLKCYLSCLW